MSSMIGNKVKITIFGESHGEKIGVVMDGLPAGEAVDTEKLQAFLRRRAPGSALTSARSEKDIPHIVSGVMNGMTCGMPLCVLFDNADARSQDYELTASCPRPGHADLTAHVKFGGYEDYRGGGHFSGRLTAPLCAAGGILMQIFERKGITIGAHILEIHGQKDEAFDPIAVDSKLLKRLSEAALPVIDENAGKSMLSEVENAKNEQDSVGGVIECAVLGLPDGLGEPMFDGLENTIAKAVFGIPAVKGIEFGGGFGASMLKGSENNDPYTVRDGKIHPVTNHAGGILGGISTGAPLIFRAAFKPTPSIGKIQKTVSYSDLTEKEILISGRHDPCIVLRAVPCVEAAAAVALADFIL